MNKIVLDHYPVSKLPADMREGLEKSATVRVVIEEEDDRDNLAMNTAAEAANAIRQFRKELADKTSSEEAVKRIRELRDEWDSE